MQVSDLKLKVDSSQEWVNCVISNFDEFLKDHADCERKASSMAMSFVAKYPDRTEIIPELIHTGIEELEHFRLVYKIMEERGLTLNHSIPEDLYVKQLLKHCHSDREKRFRDRLIIASIVENRGFERFKLVSENIQDEELAKFYHMIYVSEAKHGHIFVEMALNYFDRDEVFQRWEELAIIEAEILNGLELKPALH
ncbi:hydroxylase for synthesis of 2-methylthio-cis-ribozeatin in tRNA [Owenweeksia hongkongensis DSM 17368]|uniref:Hydroxylase for synthesis of 2-methylthio-cis-ribozeatin in tRNA n=1 Tax=Owenweeksia hongkongensis (strain DSM 17368 / CIP 108786 / JCM 12287 / NRRL B-23963 / UST20020801) TaxID=926562 RepID=G8R0A4_OWEHD|nr:tRNA-(ms[2]io[6]A)-hydroxylase [Owenweeksia hongkongensis]AEV31564.1 hydroxylase for synthesis of 2-methylthio-cis-ribozeatin in tRNA [Owenweeksia hongkongensis DSM 17368]